MENLSERMKDNNANTLLCAVIESTTGYSCPNYGAIYLDTIFNNTLLFVNLEDIKCRNGFSKN